MLKNHVYKCKIHTSYIELPFPKEERMKKRFFSVFLLLALAVLISISCQTAPEADETPSGAAMTTQPGVSTQSSQQESSPPPVQVDPAARARADAARQQAVDFDSPDYFPSEWEAAEAQFRAAGTTAAYNAAADAYDELFRKTVPLYAQAMEDQIMAARDELIATGLAPYFPELLREADDITLTALDQYEAEDYINAKTTADKALQKYKDYLTAANGYLLREELLATGLGPEFPDLLNEADDIALSAIDHYEAEEYDQARNSAAQAIEKYEDYLYAADIYLTRQEVIDRGFVRFDSVNFSRADDAAMEGVNQYLAGDKDAAAAAGEEALLRYNIVLSNGWVYFAGERRGNASSERELAMEERANIASRENFREGDHILDQAESLLAAGNFNEAAAAFISAEAMYAIARVDTRDRRRRAEEAIRTADQRIGDSDETAREAERIIEGGSR